LPTNLLWGVFDLVDPLLVEPLAMAEELAAGEPAAVQALLFKPGHGIPDLTFYLTEPPVTFARAISTPPDIEPSVRELEYDSDAALERLLGQAAGSRGALLRAEGTAGPAARLGAGTPISGDGGATFGFSEGQGEGGLVGGGGALLGGGGNGDLLPPPGGPGLGGGGFEGGGPSGPESGCGSDISILDDDASTDEDTPINIYYLLYNDTDPQLDTIVITEITQPAHGMAVLEDDQTVTYTPSMNWSGEDTFTYHATDNNGNCGTATVTVTVNPINDAPVADAQNLTTNEDIPLAVTLTGSDVEDDELGYLIFDGPAHGTLSEIDGDQLSYVPAGNFSGADSFTVQAWDGQDLSEPATIAINVVAVSDTLGVTITPSAGSTNVMEGDESTDDYTVVLNTPPTADVNITLTPDAQVAVDQTTLTFTPVNWAVHQTVTVSAVDDDYAEADPHPGVISHATASADPLYNGVTVPSHTASVTDNDIAWVYADPGEQLRVNEAGTTSDTFTLELTSKPTANVTVSLTPDAQVTLSSGSLTFTPATWNTPQTVTATAVDDMTNEGYHFAIVTLSVTSGDGQYDGLAVDLAARVYDNETPNALPDHEEADEDTPLTIFVLANDFDPEGDPMTVVNVSQGAHGTVVVNFDQTVTYTPELNWYGFDSFTYHVTDGNSSSNAAKVHVHVLAVNDNPTVVVPPTQTKAEDASISLQISALDVDGDHLDFEAPTETDPFGNQYRLPPGLMIDHTGRIFGIIEPNAAGTYHTKVIVTDYVGGSTTITFTWIITDTAHAPMIAPVGDQTDNIGLPPNWKVFANDIDGGTLTYFAVGLPTGLSINPGTGKIEGDFTAGGAFETTLGVLDDTELTDTTTFNWSVAGPNIPIPTVTIAIEGIVTPPGQFSPEAITLLHPTQTVQAYVTLSYSFPVDPLQSHQVELFQTPTGRSQVMPSILNLLPGQTGLVIITPKAVSQEAYDVRITSRVDGVLAGSKAMTNVGVKIPDTIQAWDTPKNMKNTAGQIIYRIPPRSKPLYHANVIVAPNLMNSEQRVHLDIENQSDLNGRAQVLGFTLPELSLLIFKGSYIAIIGTAQTAPHPTPRNYSAPNAGKLVLYAQVGVGADPVRLRSKGFSVAAIPLGVHATKPENFVIYGEFINDPSVRGWVWGLRYSMKFHSDSDVQSDLDEVLAAEFVTPIKLTGAFEGPQVGVTSNGLFDPVLPDQIDINGIFDNKESREKTAKHLAALIAKKGGGVKELEQYFQFSERRTGVPPDGTRAATVPYSGFLIKMEAFEKDKNPALPQQGAPSINVSRERKSVKGAEYAFSPAYLGVAIAIIGRQIEKVLVEWHGLAAQVSQNAEPLVLLGGQPVAPNRTPTT
jgi:hypothetical protein